VPVFADWGAKRPWEVGGITATTVTDAEGRFTISGLPQGTVTIYVQESYAGMFPSLATTVEVPTSGVELKARRRRPADGPAVIGEPVLPATEVDWLGASPVIGDGADTMFVFVTAHDPASGKFLAAVSRLSGPRMGRPMKTVVVFDSSFSLAETRKCAAEWGVADMSARVKDVRKRGRESMVFKRYGVPAVPSDIAVDGADRPIGGVRLNLNPPRIGSFEIGGVAK
jgi:hypothetical protein